MLCGGSTIPDFMLIRITLLFLCGLAASCGRIDYDPLASADAGNEDTEAVDGGDSTDGDIGSAAWNEDTYIKSSNPDAYDWFAGAVALSTDGSTLAVGAKFEDGASTGIGGDASDNSASGNGAVYVFVRSAGSWQQQAYIKADNADADDYFGSLSLSGDGNTLAVGASREDSAATGVNGNGSDNSKDGSGAAYVFTREAGVWTQEAYLKASNSGADDNFGGALSLSDDGLTLAVGATGEASAALGFGGAQDNNEALDSGAVYLFTRGATTWSQTGYLKASNTQAGDEFGTALSLSSDGGVLAVGASLEDGASVGTNGDQSDNSKDKAGAVYVFSRSGASWSQGAYLKPSAPDAYDLFGHALSLSGDGQTLAVDSPLESSAARGIGGDSSDNSSLAAGAVYVFSTVGGGWTQEAYIKASNTDSTDRFGNALRLSHNGSTLAIGARKEDSDATGIDGDEIDNSAEEAGAVYVFQRSQQSWQQHSYIKAFNTGSNDVLGDSIGLSGDGATLAVGAPGEASMVGGINGDASDNSGDGAGAVYIYER